MPFPVPRYVASRIIRALPRRTISHLVGQACDVRLPPPLSRALVKTYGMLYGVDMSDVLPRSEAYESFDHFFTRELVPSRRPISDLAKDVVSPADGQLQAIGRVEKGCRIMVKTRPYDVARLVGSERDARAMRGGQFAVVYLSPSDYHRVHAPVTGLVRELRCVAGDLYPVNTLGERCSRALLVENQRVTMVIDTPDLGRVLLVLVGAMVVGRITVTMLPYRNVPPGTYPLDPPATIERGDDVGAFHLGSTAVVLVGPDAPAWQRPHGLIRVGESLMRAG